MTNRVIKRILMTIGIVASFLLVFLFNSPTVKADTTPTTFNSDLKVVPEDDPSASAGALSIYGTIPDTDLANVTYGSLKDNQGYTGADMLRLFELFSDYQNGVLANWPAIKSQLDTIPGITDDSQGAFLQVKLASGIESFEGYTIDVPKALTDLKAHPTITAGIENTPTINFPVKKNTGTATINYVYADGKPALVKNDEGKLVSGRTVSGIAGQSVTVTNPAIDGYVTDHATMSLKLSDTPTTFTITYHQPNTPVTRADSGSITTTPAETTAPAETTPATTIQGGAANQVTAPRVAKQEVVYGLKTIYLYRNPTFSKKQRVAKYPRVNRTQRPMFVVTGYAHAKSGRLRYAVKDVNHGSATYGKTGYLTARAAFLAPVYYRTTPKHVKVIATKGINAYRKVNLTTKIQHIKSGTILNVVSIKHFHKTTRFVLRNGHIITANKKLVMLVK